VYINPNRPRRLWIGIAAGFALACQSTGARDRPESADRSSAAPPSKVAVAPREPSKPPEPGTLPSVPLPVGSVVELPTFRTTVLDFERGEAASHALHAASSANPSAPSGREYALVRLRVTGVAPGSWVGCKDFRVVGANRTVYPQAGQLPPEPPLASEVVQADKVFEGWCTYSIQSSDRALMMMINDPDVRYSTVARYVALEQGASLARFSPGVDAAAQPIGKSPSTPVEPGSEVVTRDWSVKVVDVVRGEDARQLVESANSRNQPPAEGLEFVAIKLHARYHGRSGQTGLLSSSEFQVIGRNGEPYENPIVLDVTPRLSRTLFPGGEHTGWAVFQIDPADSNAVLRFKPYFPDVDVRYLSLTTASAHAERALEGAPVPTNESSDAGPADVRPHRE
jgi:hypothetical protein